MCRLSGGHLASINDGFTNAFVSHGGEFFVKKNDFICFFIGNEAFLIMEEDDFWVGGQNLEDQTKWEWVDGKNTSLDQFYFCIFRREMELHAMGPKSAKPKSGGSLYSKSNFFL